MNDYWIKEEVEEEVEEEKEEEEEKEVEEEVNNIRDHVNWKEIAGITDISVNILPTPLG